MMDAQALTKDYEDKINQLLTAITKRQKENLQVAVEQNHLHVNLLLLKQINPQSAVLLEFRQNFPTYKI